MESNNQELLDLLNALRDSSTVIVTVGNTLKGDDGAGPLVCRELVGKISAELIDAGTVPENYIQTIIRKSPQHLLVIDAIDFKAAPGAIRLFKPEELNSLAISTHALSPRVFVDMICQSIKVDVYFIGIQPAHTQLGQPVSAQVRRAIQWLVRALIDIFPAPA